jgi:fibronectin-binding autotransporter adhesin
MSEIIVSGTTISVTTIDASNTYLVESSGVLEVLNGGLVSGLITVGNPAGLRGTLVVSSGGTTLSTTIGANALAYDFGAASGTTISYGGRESVVSGGTESGTDITYGGLQNVGGDGIAIGALISYGGEQDVVGDGIAIGATISYGAPNGSATAESRPARRSATAAPN